MSDDLSPVVRLHAEEGGAIDSPQLAAPAAAAVARGESHALLAPAPPSASPATTAGTTPGGLQWPLASDRPSSASLSPALTPSAASAAPLAAVAAGTAAGSSPLVTPGSCLRESSASSVSSSSVSKQQPAPSSQAPRAPLAFLASFNSSFTYEQRDQAPVSSPEAKRASGARRRTLGTLNSISNFGTAPVAMTAAAAAAAAGTAPGATAAVPALSGGDASAAAPMVVASQPQLCTPSSPMMTHTSMWPASAIPRPSSSVPLPAASAAAALAASPVSASGAAARSEAGIELSQIGVSQRDLFHSQPRQLRAHSLGGSSSGEETSRPRPGLVSEAPSMAGTPEKSTPRLPNKTLQSSLRGTKAATAAGVSYGLAAQSPTIASGGQSAGSPGGGATAAAAGASVPHATAPVFSSSSSSSVSPGSGKPVPSAIAGAGVKKADDASAADVFDDAASGAGGGPRLTCMRFNMLFLILTVAQVVLCAVVVWYLGDRNARAIVSSLSQDIRADVLHKMQAGVTQQAVQVLSAVDQMYNSIDQLPDLTRVLRDERVVSTSNASFLFPLAWSMSKFPSVPGMGVITPRDVLITARRPHLLQVYLDSVSNDAVSSSPVQCTNTPSDPTSCIFKTVAPVLDGLLADPDEMHEYAVREFRDPPQINETDLTLAPTPNINFTTSSWDFNARQWQRFRTGGLPAWDPVHSMSDFAPFLTGPRTARMLRDYADYQKADALAAGKNGSDVPPGASDPRPVYATFGTAYKNRPVYRDTVALNGNLGWTRTFVGASNQVMIAAVKARMRLPSEGRTDDLPIIFLSYAYLYYQSLNAGLFAQLKASFKDRREFATAQVLVFERSGWLVAATLTDLPENEQSLQRTHLMDSEHPFIAAIRAPLVNSGLVVPNDRSDGYRMANVSLSNSATNRAYDSLLLDRGFSMDGDSWHLRASPVTSALGLSWVVVVCTLDSDFDGGFASNSRTTAWTSALVGILCIVVTLLVVQCLTRPLLKLTDFMSDITFRLLVTKNDPVKQNAELVELRSLWQQSIENPHLIQGKSIEHELAELRRRRRQALKKRKLEQKAAAAAAAKTGKSTSFKKRTLHASAAASAADSSGGESAGGGSKRSESPGSVTRSCGTSDLSDDGSNDSREVNGMRRDTHTNAKATGGQGATAAATTERAPPPSALSRAARRLRKFCCWRLPQCVIRVLPVLPLRETQLLHRTFNGMLIGLQSSHEQLQSANESKRRFIRYIFHEVRVPFNAIVLGVEQLREDLYTEPLRPVDEMQDVVNILNEQSKVVARILNDVLSLQKIEDGALQLEMAPFSLIEMVCGTLRSFQPLLAEKGIVLMTELEDVDQASIRAHVRRWEKEMDRRQQQQMQDDKDEDGDAEDTKAKGAETTTGASDAGALSVRIDRLGGSVTSPQLVSVATGVPASLLPLATAPPLSTVINPSPPLAGAVAANGAAAAAGSPIPASTPASSPASATTAPSLQDAQRSLYLNAYEDSKELQRIAEQCSREVLGDRYRLRQVLGTSRSSAAQ